uniref:Ig-like domain-containing protein n=1 Tax=Knipowitschia caucasica TaxID=637954 RepID=A0AAV2JDG0_KNICA
MHCVGTGSVAFFGGGTKLTVLEKDQEITPPTVEVFAPSEKERPQRRDGPKAKTLVCVARDFYPDHVTVSWQVNKDSRVHGVSTDTEPQRQGKKYTISSRLRVTVEEWTQPDNIFTCIVSFFNGRENKDYEDNIRGIKEQEDNIQVIKEQEDSSWTREEYLKMTQHAKLSYTLLIAKGVVYGLFVAFLIWRVQALNGKQT